MSPAVSPQQQVNQQQVIQNTEGKYDQERQLGSPGASEVLETYEVSDLYLKITKE